MKCGSYLYLNGGWVSWKMVVVVLEWWMVLLGCMYSVYVLEHTWLLALGRMYLNVARLLKVRSQAGWYLKVLECTRERT